MKMHLNDGQLRAYLDVETGEDEKRHLAECPQCRARLEAMAQQVSMVRQRLSFLSSKSEELQPSSFQALASLKSRMNKKKEISLMNIFSTRRFHAAAASLVVIMFLAIILGVPQFRAWAGEFLGLFRVQQVTALPIDTTTLSQLSGNSALGSQIANLISTSVTLTQKPGDSQTAADASQASQMAGFTVRLPTSQTTTPTLSVQPGMAFQFVVDEQRVQELLNEAGRSDLVLPSSLNGATIKVTIPTGVSASYGDCPTPGNTATLGLNNGSGSNIGATKQYPNCIVLAEIPSPTVLTPPNVDLTQLAEIALQFTGMTAQQAQSFAQTVNWTSTLVIPIPVNAATYQQVSVDGVNGILISRAPDDAPQYALVWVKDGIIYAVGGLGTDTNTAMDMANSLK
jgi:anti-sigma factor RsiW